MTSDLNGCSCDRVASALEHAEDCPRRWFFFGAPETFGCGRDFEILEDHHGRFWQWDALLKTWKPLEGQFPGANV